MLLLALAFARPVMNYTQGAGKLAVIAIDRSASMSAADVNGHRRLDEAKRLARLLAAKPDDKLLGKTEFEVRDAVHRLGASALQAALDGRKKGGIRGRA